MTTTLLTAYNKDIQRFMMHGERCSTRKKKAILESIEENVINKGDSFEALFPPKSKRMEILDYIIFMASGSGICKVSGSKISEVIGCHINTVTVAVKNIKATGEFLVAGLADGKNKYVFVLKSHLNFHRILKEVFFLDNVEENVGQIVEQENAKSVGAVGTEGGKSSPNHNNFFISKQERNIIQQSIENEANSFQKIEDEKAYIDTYFVNEFQHGIFNYIKDEMNGFHDDIKGSAAVIGLRMGSNSKQLQFVNAIKTIIKINGFLKNGGVVREGIPALFTSIYKHGLDMFEYERQYKLRQQQNAMPEVPKVKRVPFYNWLEERE